MNNRQPFESAIIETKREIKTSNYPTVHLFDHLNVALLQKFLIRKTEKKEIIHTSMPSHKVAFFRFVLKKRSNFVK